MKKNLFCISTLVILILSSHIGLAQLTDSSYYWHNIPRTVRYHPEGADIVITNGNRRFTRALYGTNTAFRVEAGDLPEFAMYLPGMGGNLKFGIISGDSSRWLIAAKNIVARYRPGSMLYDITDPLLGKGVLHLHLLAMSDAEGLVLKITSENVPQSTQLIWAFGGVSGKKFSRDGDMNVDPESSFYLKPEYCNANRFTLQPNGFTLQYGVQNTAAEVNRYQDQALPTDSANMGKILQQALVAALPGTGMHIADAASQNTPDLLFNSTESATPLITGKLSLSSGKPLFIAIKKPDARSLLYDSLTIVFQRAEAARQLLASRIIVQTPDPYINTLGGVIGIAADAIWESPTFMHGSIGWRMRLNGWRGPYVADELGWHDRARLHFRSYSQSQITTPATGPVVMDTALHLARSLEKLGTSVYSSGYISRNPGGDFRPHHYDMNLVYIDQLLRHFNWTGDTAFVREMWPVITRHLAWEKRNFDSDDDGLYDAYAAIWASDALEYSGGGVTHSSAYNYYANKQAAMLAGLIGENARPYEQEAAKILAAMNKRLWMPETGSFAEYQDALGEKQLHPSAGLWTFYHAMDSEVPNALQGYQMMRRIDQSTPHIPVRAKDLPDSFYTLSTTNWMPYDWSLNNVATAEVLHTALANWQAGRNEEAFQLWKSELLSTMYLGGSPGNIGQISFYDAARGEAYRDFGDPVGMTSRSLVEGLFGILPDALHNQLVIRPGFPSGWKKASIQTPDIAFNFQSVGNTDTYIITPSFRKMLVLRLRIKARKDQVLSVMVNGKKANWKTIDSAVGQPEMEIICPVAKKYDVKMIWGGNAIEKYVVTHQQVNGTIFTLPLHGALARQLIDPQQLFKNPTITFQSFSVPITNETGAGLAFLKMQQGYFSWWQPLEITVIKPVTIIKSLRNNTDKVLFDAQNNTDDSVEVSSHLNDEDYGIAFYLKPHESKRNISFPSVSSIPGINAISLSYKNNSGKYLGSDTLLITNWNAHALKGTQFDTVNITPYFNDKVTQIFKHQYLSPRPTGPTLQLPTQGIGDWTHPLKTANIYDIGLRTLAGAGNEIVLPQGIPFATPSDTLKPNILFTSQWDNFPRQISIPLSGNASHAYFLMAGSTNPMQSRITNGAVMVYYTDGSSDSLLLKNPETWWPIEQDYMDDGYAFQINAARPVRIHLKTGKIISDYDNSIAPYAGKMIDGGAATVLDLPLNFSKSLKSLQVQARANDVIIGLMSITLVRK